MSTLFQLCVASVLLLIRTASIVSSQQSVYYFFYQRPAYPRDCKEWLDSCHYQRSSGVYVVKPDGYHRPFEVYCDNTLDSGGWTVILRRHDGSVTFKRDWLDYKGGFGFLSQELWIGHEKLSFLTNQKIYELRIDITYSDGTSIHALYSLFCISDDFSNYRLSAVGLYSGTNNILKCPLNMEYGTCSGCQSSCGDSQNCLPCPQNEACFCPNGFYLKGTDCVTKEECGCYITGVTIREGEVYTAPGCSRRCFCISDLLICDDNYRCSNNAVCERRNNVLQCYCNEGYVGDGITCEKNCPTNTVFGTCTFQTLCAYPQISLPCTGEMCYCPTGFYLQGGDCVRQQDCGCYINGHIVQEGQSYTAPACTRRCSCDNGQLSCDNSYRCDPNAACLEQSNMYHCTCNEGFISFRDTCVSICSTNEIYGPCNCERSCGKPENCTLCISQGQRCFCPNGFYLQGQDCVRLEECHCFTDGTIIPEGQTYIAPGCSKRCFCINGQLSCYNSYRCDTNAACLEQDSMHQCTCNEGFTPSGDTCVSICSTNEIYGTCNCERTCGNPGDCSTLCSTQGERCYCRAGFYLQGQDCVRQEDCNCFTDGSIISEGHTYIAPGCSKRCFCINGQLSCDDSYRCDPNAACLEQNNMYQCTCNEGFTPSGDTCVSICSTNEMYGTCICENSCGNPDDCSTLCNSQDQRCYCPNGFYLQGQNCVRDYECGCYIDGTIVPNSGTYVDSECSQQCTCNNDQLNCNNYQCSPNAVCRVEDDVRKCYCIDGYEGDGETCTTTYADCYDAYQAGQIQDGVYSILPSGWTGSSFDVPCNMSVDGGGWTVLQRRVDGSEDFEHNWNGYKNGFGVLGGEVWLGNDKIYFITNQRDYELRMDMVNLDGNAYFAKYDLFRVKNEDSNYQLELGTFDSASTADFDAMNYHRDQFFSTPDRDNDARSSYNCAASRRSAWWYNSCDNCDFNRRLFGRSVPLLSPDWDYLPGSTFFMYTDIKIRPV